MITAFTAFTPLLDRLDLANRVAPPTRCTARDVPRSGEGSSRVNGRLAARTQPDRVPDGGTRGRAQPASSPTPSRRSERVIASLVEPAFSRPTS